MLYFSPSSQPSLGVTINNSIFITGSAGFLGSHLLAHACEAPDISSVYGLARSNADTTASGRIANALHSAGFAPKNLVYTPVESDIAKPLCGIDPNASELTANPAHDIIFLHAAATLNWHPSHRSHITLTNEVGTQNALMLAQRLGAKLFAYVSTAYTCGRKDGLIEEQLHPHSIAFNNLYEQSKFNAEQQVAEFCTRHNMRFILLRPSIILGCSHNHKASGSDTGLYGLIRGLRQIGQRARQAQETVRLKADVNSSPSLIPVDHVVEQIFCNLNRFKNDPSRTIFHVTPKLDEHSATAGQILEDIFKKLRCQDLFHLVDYEIKNKTPLERLLARRMSFFSPYFNSSKIFSHPANSKTSISAAEISKYIDTETVGMTAIKHAPRVTRHNKDSALG